MRQDLQWYPKSNSVNTVNNRLSADDLAPNQMQDMSNFSYDELGALKKISGNQPITTITEYTSRPDDTDMVDLYWDADSNPINSTELRPTTIGLKFTDAFIATLSGLTLYETYLYLDSADANSVSGTAYRNTATFTEASAAPPTYDTATSASISHAGGVNTEQAFQIPNAWVTSWLTNNYGMQIRSFTGTGYFDSSAFPTTAKGYFFSGIGATEIDGINFADESSINPSAACSSTSGAAGVNSATHGYIALGNSTDIASFNFSTESYSSFTSANLIEARWGLAGVNSSTYGYFGGGSDGGADAREYIDGIKFSDESSVSPFIDLSSAMTRIAGVNSSSKGYWAGGCVQISPYSSINLICGIKFSDESAVTVSATLNTQRSHLVGVNSTVNGYFIGGYNGSSNLKEIDGIQFSDESSINPSAELVTGTNRPMGVNSTTAGYIAGGNMTLSAISRLNFYSEECSSIGATLVTGRYAGAGVQSGGIL